MNKITQRKVVVDRIIQRVDQAYLDKLTAEGVHFEKQVVQTKNAALEFTVVVVDGKGDDGARFFADHFVTAQFPSHPNVFRPGCSYRVIKAWSHTVGFNDEYFVTPDDVCFDLVSPGVVQLSEAPIEPTPDYERLLKDLLAGVSVDSSKSKLKLYHVLERALNTIRLAITLDKNCSIVSPSNRSIVEYLDRIVRTLETRDYIGVSVEDALEKQASNAG